MTRSRRTGIGWPGEFPFTRGLYATGYRGKPWTIRQFSGFGNAKRPVALIAIQAMSR